jgi:hypothetical protein
MSGLLQRALRKAREWLHGRQARAVLDTPPRKVADAGPVLFSMIGTRVLLPYLVAAKSLHRQLGQGRFVILDDGTLTASDRAVLARHLDSPQIVHIDDVDTGPCPRGGTWERLLTLLDLRREGYVIQLDSDTVTVGPVPEVERAIAEGRGFILPGDDDSELLGLAEIAARTPRHHHRDTPGSHVQGAIESVMDEVAIPGREGLRYIRGCSGFAGFAPSDGGRVLAEAFSLEASRLLGERRWAEWGSEQVTSNFVLANEPDSLVLPSAKYVNFWDEDLPAGVGFVHFIGTCRYHRGAYTEATRRAIAELNEDSAPTPGQVD